MKIHTYNTTNSIIQSNTIKWYDSTKIYNHITETKLGDQNLKPLSLAPKPSPKT